MKITIYILLFLMSVHLLRGEVVPVYLDDSKNIEARIEDALKRMTLEEKVAMIHAQSKFSTPGCPRLGIPELWMSDGPHGVRMEIEWDSWRHAGWTNDSCVAFPALTCLAATFNPQLAYEYGKALGEEARYRKKEVILGPGVNIYRSPLNGRNFEYMGEDPFLASTMVVPYIKGVQENGVAASLKHFALNNQEQWRKHINVEVSDRALHEIYLPAFKAGVTKGKVWTVMGAYNKFRSQYASHNKILINEILKKDWGFDGVVVTDWGSAHDTREAALNGLDMEMGTRTDGLSYTEKMAYDSYYLAQAYLDMLISGELPVSTLDDKVRRVLRLTFRTAMNRSRPYGSFVTQAHYDVARKVATEGIVLLKNTHDFFPVEVGKYKKIVIIGDNATRSLTVGGGSSELKVKKEISPLEALNDIYGKNTIEYTMGYTSGPSKFHPHIPLVQKSDSLRKKALEVTKDADIVLFFGGLNKNYKQDCEGVDRDSFDLPYEQDQLLNDILNANPNTGVVLITGNAVSMPWVDKIPALLQSWYLGSEAGSAIADIISGKINPSGKLPFSIPKYLDDNAAHSFGSISYPGDSINVVYKEDILVGYRWHDTKKIPALFPFGFGLSYTTFKYEQLRTDKTVYHPTDTIRLSLTISNTGIRQGAESVQVYVSQQNPKLKRPIKELKAFAKVDLQPQTIKPVSIDIPVKDLAYFDDSLQRWVIDSDKFTLLVGASSVDIRQVIDVQINSSLSWADNFIIP